MKSLFAVFLSLLFSVAASAQTMPAGGDPALWQKALKLHGSALIVDGHNDVTTPMYDEGFDLNSDSAGRYHIEGTPFHTDFKRLKAGNITGNFFSIYVSAEYAQTGGAMARAMNLIDTVYREAEKYPDKMMMAVSTADIRKARKEGKVAALMGIEGGHAIEDSLYALRNFYRLGVRYITLTHNNTNNWADACCDRNEDGSPKRPHGGLSDFGKDVVREMNRLGMLVDLSHVSDDTMRDVFEISTAPVIYSHSSARKFSDHPRNVPDDILRLLAKNGGVIMINFYPGFLDQRNLDEDSELDAEFRKELGEILEKFKNDADSRNKALRELYSRNPIYFPPYSRIVDHIDHVRDIAGIDVVGLGSDYDGVPWLPEGMNGAEDHILVTYEMLRRGYSEEDVLKVLGGNFMRAFEKAEEAAKIGSREISGEGIQRKIQ
ncbi:MAG: membrane dipeptidase [Acidobacteria bacterium]|nr:MAG: membrane dipeptidase [Acidobacteriota bacterium]REK02222.1 MAG: membrane dipeptidase [Acidobacteriota bacterium]REK13975.1 MAG: membrane dipeptidase [Acidobacteriota bacterium]REK41970.1 MAG: membrane dipeptidase [Acidobacteriota bacterium]